ncbi:unnamed protein product, partial [Nesidiocoris tenuis]
MFFFNSSGLQKRQHCPIPQLGLKLHCDSMRVRVHPPSLFPFSLASLEACDGKRG